MKMLRFPLQHERVARAYVSHAEKRNARKSDGRVSGRINSARRMAQRVNRAKGLLARHLLATPRNLEIITRP